MAGETKVIASKEESKYYPFTGIYKWARETFWQAGQDSYTAPPAQDPDMFLQLINVEPVTRGILQRRRGYSLFSLQAPTVPFTRSFAFRSEALSLRRLVWTSPSTILATDEAGLNVLSPVFTPSANAHAPRMVLSRDFGYFADGVAADSKKWDGTQNANSVTNWGISLNASTTATNDATIAADQGNSGTNGSQGPLNCGTGASSTWTNPSNVAVTGAFTSAAVAALSSSGTLNITNFGFNVPAGSTINGIVVNFTRQAGSTGFIVDNGIFILQGGTAIGTDHSAGGSWVSSSVNVSYGSSGDLWGTTWTPAQINASNFGFQINVKNVLPSPPPVMSAEVFAFPTITVFYTLPPNPSWTNPNGSFQNNPATPAFATATITNTSELRDSGFGLTPAASTAITGIQVAISCMTSGGVVNLSPVLVKSGTVTGSRKTLQVTSTSFSTVTFGGQFDTWGGNWLGSDWNGVATSGVQYFVSTTSGSATFSVDRVQITLFTQAGPLTVGAPTGSGSINLISGRTYFYTFENSRTGANSTLSPASLSTGAVSNAAAISLSGIPTPVDTQADTVLILCTADGNDQTTLFLNGSVPAGTSTFTDITPDTVLLTNAVFQQTDTIGQLHGVANNNPPPVADFPTKHKGRLYMAQGHNLFFSKSLDDVTTSTGTITSKWEEAWPFVNIIDLSEFSETVRALLSDGETLWIGTERNIRRLIGDGPLNFQKPEIQFNETGVLNPEVWKVVFYEGQPVGTMWMTPDFRVISSDFNTYKDVGTPIQDVLNTINPAAVQNCHALYVNKQAFDLYILYIPTGTNSIPDTACVYNLRTQRWSIWLPTDQTSTSLFNINVNGVTQWLFGTAAGALYFWDSTVLQDRNGNGPVSYPVTIQTSWQDCGDYTWWKVLNLQILTSDDNALTLAIDGAVTNLDFGNPTQVLPATVVTPSELRAYLQLPLTTTQARHYWFRFTWLSPASTIQNVLTSVHTEVVPFSRF